MTDRRSIVQKALEALANGKLPFSSKVDDVPRDFKKISEMLRRRGKNDSIGMSKDPDKDSIWFRKRR